MDKLKTSAVGGFPLLLNDLRQFFGRLGSPSHGIYQAFNNLLSGFGSNMIIQGCFASGTSPNVTLTEGWILLQGELIKVDAQTEINTSTDNKFVKVVTFDPRGTKTFQNSTISETYEKNRAIIQGTSGNLAFDSNARFEFLTSLMSKGSDTDPGATGIITLPKVGRMFSVVDNIIGGDADIEFMTERPISSIVRLIIDGGTARKILSTSGGGLPNDANGKLTNRIRTHSDPSYTTNALEILTFQSVGVGTFGGWNLIGTSRIASIGNGIMANGVNSDNVLTRTRKLSIGDWNMDADIGSLSIVHGITDVLTKSPVVNVSIFNNAGSQSSPLLGQVTIVSVDKLGGSYQLNDTTIILSRVTDGLYDDSNFDSTSFNRGHIYITYEA